MARKKMGLYTYFLNHGLQELASVAPASSIRFSPQIHEVVGVVVLLAQDFSLSVMKQRQKFIIVTLSSFGGELEVEPPHTAAE